MHFVFISSLLTLGHHGSYPMSEAPWPTSTSYIVKSNVTYNPMGCTSGQIFNQTRAAMTWFRRGLIGSITPNTTKAFAMSPLAVSIAIAMVTGAPVEKDIPLNRTRLSDVECLQLLSLQPLVDHLKSYRNVGLVLAWGVFVSPKLELHPEFIETITKTFRTSMRRVDFEDPTERSKFNERWTSNEGQSLVDADTSLAVVNVIRFKAEWEHKFNPEWSFNHTAPDSSGKPITTQVMRGYSPVRHGIHPKTHAYFYELPFKSGDDGRKMSMFMIMPEVERHSGSWTAVEHLESFNITDLQTSGEYSTIGFYIPKFKVQSVVNIGPAVDQVLGKGGIFTTATTKLAGISPSSDLYGDKFEQRISIEIDENGCEAFTSDDMRNPMPPTLPPGDITPRYVLIAITGENPQIIFVGRFYR